MLPNCLKTREILKYKDLYIAAHSRQCKATSQHLRHACLHRVPRHCLCFFFWLKSALRPL